MGLKMKTVIAALVVLPTSLNAAVGEDATPKVFAHYYTWWAGDRPEYPLMPKSGWYSHHLDAKGRPKPPNLFLRHIAQARSAGLAGFSCEWPGKESPETKLILDGLVTANNRLSPKRRMQYLLCFDSTIWAMEYKKLIKEWYEPIPFTEQIAKGFAAEMGFVCNEVPKQDRNFKTSYLHIDGRPAVFVYNAHGFSGAWEQAISLARKTCEASGGIYLIGDFEVSPHAMFDEKRKEEYPCKASHFDAVTNYTLFSGHTFMSLWEYISSGQLDSALQNGKCLAEASQSKQFYPGIIPQYFKSKKAHANNTATKRRSRQLADRAFVTDGSAGFVPIYKPTGSEDREAVVRNSRCTLQILLRKTLQAEPQVVFITSWNEPYEGTMIEPTRSPNPAGYVMNDDFLDLIASCLRESSPGWGDFDVDGHVDDQDETILQSCLNAETSDQQSPCCMLADKNGNGKVDEEDLKAFQSCRDSNDQEQGRKKKR